MKRIAAAVLLLLMIASAATAFAAASTYGRTRIIGVKDEVIKPTNMFAPYAEFLDRHHVENRYLEFDYTKLDSNERVWAFEVQNKEGEPRSVKGEWIRVHLPFPSIWSAQQGEYWKWTKNYAKKHYTWYYAKGNVLGTLKVMIDGEQVINVALYSHEDYRPLPDTDLFGPYIDMHEKVFAHYNALFIKFYGIDDGKKSSSRAKSICFSVKEEVPEYQDYTESSELILPAGATSLSYTDMDGKEQKLGKIKSMFWPKSMTDAKIVRDVAPNVKEIRYAGTKEEWNKVKNRELFSGATIIFEGKEKES